jgi:hypothetical protein
VTEAEWLVCGDPEAMLKFLRGKISERKLRLFGVACCRRIWHLLDDERSRVAVEVAERFADGLASEEERAARRQEALAASNEARLAFEAHPERGWDALCLAEVAADAADYALYTPGLAKTAHHAWKAVAYARNVNRTAVGSEEEKLAQCRLLREVMGNPFRPVALDPLWLRWNDGTLVALSHLIYHERGFERLPLLADALEDAGCTNADVLNHFRGPGIHVRGCWVVDLLLGKAETSC